jgi:hypothetical protein
MREEYALMVFEMSFGKLFYPKAGALRKPLPWFLLRPGRIVSRLVTLALSES